MYTESAGTKGGERWLYLAVLALAISLRLPALPAGLPYIGYVDEGHVLHQTSHMLAQGTCGATAYNYPPLPACAIAVATAAWSPLYRAVHGRPLAADLSPAAYHYYDHLAPAELLVIGRLLTLLAALGIVALTGLFARRLAGPAAGLFAALAAALLPALVVRSAIVIVDVWAAFFAVAALLAAEVCRQGARRPGAMAAWAGVLAGLAGVSKYPAALVCLPVALAVLLSPGSARARLARLGLAAGAALLTALVAMPDLVLETARVRAEFAHVSSFYADRPMGSYWYQLVHRSEWDLPYDHPEAGLPFLAVAAAGLLMGLGRRRTAPGIAGLLLFAAALTALLAPYPFRPLRNLLALAPVACVGVGLAFALVREKLPRPFLFDAAAVAALLYLYVPPLAHHARDRFFWEDSRRKAIAWLGRQMRPGERVLVAEELAMLPLEIARLPARRVQVMPIHQAKRPLRRGNPDWVMIGYYTAAERWRLPPELTAAILERYAVAKSFGQIPIPSSPIAGRGNRLKVFILKRKEEGERVAGGSGGTAVAPGAPREYIAPTARRLS